MRQTIGKTEQAVLERLTYLAGNPEVIAEMDAQPVRSPFDGEVQEFLNSVSRRLLAARA